MPPSTFKRARVSLTASWQHQYDQGGLIIVLNMESGRKWAKAGIELTHGKPHISIVVKDRWADWSLLPVEEGGDGGGGGGVTIEMVREDDGSLWVYSVQRGERVPFREVTWGFEGVRV